MTNKYLLEYDISVCIGGKNKNMKNLNEICDFLETNAEDIVENLNEESIAVYDLIRKDFLTKKNLTANLIFQFTFRSFYKLDSAGLTYDFKKEYLSIFERNKFNTSINIKEILLELSSIPNFKGSKTVQFSFVTKMAHTINNDYPIYDNEVITVFGFKQPYYISNIDKKINKYIEQYEQIQNTYTSIIKNNLLKTCFIEFNKKFSVYNISDIMILDFIFWSAGKLLNIQKIK